MCGAGTGMLLKADTLGTETSWGSSSGKKVLI